MEAGALARLVEVWEEDLEAGASARLVEVEEAVLEAGALQVVGS